MQEFENLKRLALAAPQAPRDERATTPQAVFYEKARTLVPELVDRLLEFIEVRSRMTLRLRAAHDIEKGQRVRIHRDCEHAGRQGSGPIVIATQALLSEQAGTFEVDDGPQERE